MDFGIPMPVYAMLPAICCFYTNGIEVRNFINDTLATGLAPTNHLKIGLVPDMVLSKGALYLPESDFSLLHLS